MRAPEFVKAQLRKARMRGDAEEARRLLAALQELRKPEDTLAPKNTEKR